MVQSMEQNRGLYFVNSAEEANQKGNEALNGERLEDAVQVPICTHCSPTVTGSSQHNPACFDEGFVRFFVVVAVLHKRISYS
jgi:hypothetical protein